MPYFGVNITLAELFKNKPNYHSLNTTPLHTLPNYSISVYAKGLDVPRFMHVTTSGDLLVTEPYKGRLLLIPYNKPQTKMTLLSGLNKPHSMDIQNGMLYVAEENAIGKVKFDPLKRQLHGKYQRIINNLPDDGGHWTRTLKFGPDGFAYVSIGSSCNVCIEQHPYRATMIRFNPPKNQIEVVATGLRNSVGYDWSEEGKLYATDNGRDWLGDTFPPDELNQIKSGQFYGWPYANGNKIPDPKYGRQNQTKVRQSVPPIYSFGAHNAPLGITFIKNPTSPLYQKALVALHGSWNSSIKVGYKVISLDFDANKITQHDFITGFLKDGQVKGRPVHLVKGKHGELYLSDDFNGVIYQIKQNK